MSTAAHTFRELCDELVAVLFQSDARQERAWILGVAAVQPREELEVFPRGQLQIVVRGLECDANSTVVVSSQARRSLPKTVTLPS